MRIALPPAAGWTAAALLCVGVAGCSVAARTGSPGPEETDGPDASAERGWSAAVPGFSPEAGREQRERERRFLAALSPAGAAASARWLAAAPHMAGTDRQARLADSLAHRLRELGFRVEIERFRAWLPHPGPSSLEMLAPRRRSFDLRERYLPPEDPHGRTWNAYAAPGTARGRVVYANFGTSEDYAALETRGVDVRGRVALVRYGGVYRGVKVREAEARGAVGVILYPDPAEGGFAEGDTLPAGPHRPAGAAQRGTVSYLWRHPGDPLTPGRPATEEAARRDVSGAENLPRIPVLNVTGDRAREILAALEGPEGPESFRGGWDLPYHVGPGPARIRMRVAPRSRLRTVRNVLARLPGRQDQVVVVGNHYDAWVRGGVDPHSGTAAVLELARGLSALREEGWRPRREVLLAFWDAEEFGAVGSTEFVEARTSELRRRAVAYLNVDVLTGGTLQVSGSPSLRGLVWSAAGAVRDPLADRTLADGWASRSQDEGDRPALGALGVGSDWTAFFHHAGVPSLQWTMNGRGSYTVYHSALDDFRYLRTHADSALLHVPRMAGVMGIAALRLAEADVLPFDHVRYADRIAGLVDSVTAATSAGPAPSGDEMRALRAAIGAFRSAAERVEARRAEALSGTGAAIDLGRLNRALPRVEGDLLRAPGNGGWYRHLVYTSDPATGYGAVPLPSLRPGDGGPTVEELARALRAAAARLRTAVTAVATDPAGAP